MYNTWAAYFNNEKSAAKLQQYYIIYHVRISVSVGSYILIAVEHGCATIIREPILAVNLNRTLCAYIIYRYTIMTAQRQDTRQIFFLHIEISAASTQHCESYSVAIVTVQRVAVVEHHAVNCRSGNLDNAMAWKRIAFH